MNKKIIKLLLPVLALSFAAECAYAQDPGVKSVRRTAVAYFGVAPKPVYITHNQDIYILQDSSYTVNANVAADSDVTISSIAVQYSYSASTGTKSIALTVSTDSYNTANGDFTSIAGNSADNKIVTDSAVVYYRIAVSFSQAGMPTDTAYSGWYTLQNPKITFKYGRDILRISPYQRRMVVIGSVSTASVSDIRFDYYTNGSSVAVSTLTLNGKPSFASGEFAVPDNVNNLSYRVYTAYNSDNSRTKYYPYDLSWVYVPVTAFAGAPMDEAGGTLILDNEDRRYGYSSIVIPPSALSSAQNVKFTEMDMEKDTFPWQSSGRVIKVYKIEPENIQLSANASVTLYADELEDTGKYNIKYWNGTSWKDLGGTYNATDKTVSANHSQFGYYAIFNAKGLKDNDYRPEYRLLKFGDKMQFRNLQDGDVVTIYNLNGQQIKKLSSQPFEWDGRRDTGGYAESGSYIYQIKVNGKIISGSIAFVR